LTEKPKNQYLLEIEAGGEGDFATSTSSLR
jgi:hypothetical protein